MKNLLKFCGFMAFGYLMWAFVAAEFNPTAWDYHTRLAYVFFVPLISLFGTVFSS